MADVQPLRGLRYTPTKIGDLAQVITPPFDVISPEAQTHYYERHPYNVIRLELGKHQPTDDALNTVYTRAAATLAEWRLKGILYQETIPCYYIYQQRFSYAGQNFRRTSLLARVHLEAWDTRIILPHEHIRTKDKDDRLKLLHACATNLSPIMSTYEDAQGQIRHLLGSFAEHAEVQIMDELGDEHRVQPITDPDLMLLIHDFFFQRQLYIADGHHRYTTALHYREDLREQRRELHPLDGANFVLMALIDRDDPGWLVLPTHRLLFDLDQLRLNQLSPDRLVQYFTIQTIASQETCEQVVARLQQAGRRSPSLVLRTQEHRLLLSINEQGRAHMAEHGRASVWNELDVAIVQTLILQKLLGLSLEYITAGRYLRYSHDTQATWQAVQRQEAQAIILLNSISVPHICEIAQADERMPPKSTYLYPKLATGLVMHVL